MVAYRKCLIRTKIYIVQRLPCLRVKLSMFDSQRLFHKHLQEIKLFVLIAYSKM